MQGGDLDLRDSVMENNERMGMSALGADTKARLEGCVITGSKQHGIAQGQGAEVRVANNTVKDNTDKDVFGNVHELGGDAHKPPPPAASSARCTPLSLPSHHLSQSHSKQHSLTVVRTTALVIVGQANARTQTSGGAYAEVG